MTGSNTKMTYRIKIYMYKKIVIFILFWWYEIKILYIYYKKVKILKDLVIMEY